jgi:RND family efflux transporter MFP subunit
LVGFYLKNGGLMQKDDLAGMRRARPSVAAAVLVDCQNLRRNAPKKQDNPYIRKPRIRTRRRGLWVLVFFVGLAVAAWWLAVPQSVTVIQAVRGAAVQAVYATGTVEAAVTIRVAAQVGGRIKELKADEGQEVKAGDVLASLSDAELRASLGEMQARATYAEQQFERVGALLKQGWSTKDKYDQAQAELEAARQAVSRANELSALMQLKTPAGGRIIRRDGEVGDYVPINQPVFYLAKAGEPLRISADVDEEDIPLVKPGQRVLIRSDAFPSRVFTGEVTDITPKGDPVARSYRVRIGLPPDTALMIGMTAEANIVTADRKDTLQVPAAALADSSLWVVRGGRVERVPVEVGLKAKDRAEIISGIGEEDEVVVNPPEGLQDGQSVRGWLASFSPAAEFKR